ncbi:hypothetical protein FACS1894127_6050 [Clostridia bacterium]|nr:hypothetical protein FACS1894127_6050 [Clostridia bacterium]
MGVVAGETGTGDRKIPVEQESAFAVKTVFTGAALISAGIQAFLVPAVDTAMVDFREVRDVQAYDGFLGLDQAKESVGWSGARNRS